MMIFRFSDFYYNRWLFILFILTGIGQISLKAADSASLYGVPMRIPLLLSGNFGDIRANSFHFGLDFRTRPGTGFPVYSIADGFVSRIKVEPGGYGRIVYVQHHDGSTSSYAHLASMSKPLHDFVIAKQYQDESFTQDILFTPEQFKVKKGDILGISGNAGFSSGPHLHFEIRDTKTQNPTNPFRKNWGMNDISSPVFRSLWIYEYLPYATGNAYKKEQYKIVGGNGAFHLEKQKTISVPSKAFIGLDLFDHMTDGTRRLSFYKLNMFVDGELYYEIVLDTLRFDQMNQVNAIIDYHYKQFGKGNIYTLVKWPNMDIKNIKFARNNGVIEPIKDKISDILFEAFDLSGNKSVFRFQISAKENSKVSEEPANKENFIRWEEGGEFLYNGLKVVIPEKALFTDCYIKIEDAPLFKAKLLSPPVVVGSKGIALKKPVRLSFNISSFPESLREKIVVVSVSGLKNISSLGGTISRDRIEATTRWFGAFAIQADTVAPGIRLLNISNGKNMLKEQAIKIKISDELSGIADYKAYIDGKWVLFEYDAKNNLITHQFDRKRMTFTNSLHDLELKVTDKRGNTSDISIRFIK